MKASEAHGVQEKIARSSRLIEDIERMLKKAIKSETLSMEESLESDKYDEVYWDGYAAGEKCLAGKLQDLIRKEREDEDNI
ncbi:MAG: hypothetical protein KAR06_04245 [Deltaproteobacteria bacterium]|nr:hypothetical protein [Deltaproteobacteria bacterium]